MPLRLREVLLDLNEDENCLPAKVARLLELPESAILNLQVVRRGVDARRKSRIRRVYTVQFAVADEGAVLQRHRDNRRLEPAAPENLAPLRPLLGRHRVLVVGMGPAGLFAALRLAEYGLAVTLVEQGRPVEQRVRDVRRFWCGGPLDPHTNVQFGEGGAGTFSDGELTTRKNHVWTRLVLQTLVECGASEDILVEAKPHVGTDRLRLVLINFRRRLERAGVELRFNTRLTGLVCTAGRVRAARLNDGEDSPCDSLVLAPGHSARDTYRMLRETGVHLVAKPFAIGLRVEHPAALIDRIQFGHTGDPRLPAAEYALRHTDAESGRGVYSFCMCPGGEVVAAPSEAEGMVVNGMSFRARQGAYSNSALVVGVQPADFPGADPLAGVRFQRTWERAAFVAGGRDFYAPAQSLTGFLGGDPGPVRASCRPGVREANLAEVLPDFVSGALRRVLPHFDRRMRGFVTREATLVGVETRTSAPVRILRKEDGASVSHAGLYPAGEGAGYAGGIMSAALDGLRAAEHIADKVRKEI